MYKRSVSPNQSKVKQRRHYRCEMNNGIYEGDILQYRKDGIGMFIHDEGSTYFGGFFQDNFHGEGVLLYKKGGILYGQFERGKINGFALLFQGENYVCGYFSQSVMNGRIYHYNAQMKFWKFYEYQDGKKIRDISEEVVEDIRQLPQFLLKDQLLANKFINFLDLQIESIFKKNVNCSLSLLECEQNTMQKYVGYVDKQGNLNGLGCIFTNDSLQMCGNYEDGKIQGLGRTLHDNGDIYDGFFRRDQMEGQGIYYTQNSNSYIYAYFKRNDCIKVLNAGRDYPVQLVKKMKQKIHEKSVEYLNGFMNFKGIGINITQIVKQIQEERIFAQKRQKNQYFDISRCDTVEEEEQILKKSDFIQQEESSRASYRKSANESSMSNAIGSKLQIYNQSNNRVNPFLVMKRQNQNDGSFIDIYEQERNLQCQVNLSNSQNLNTITRNKTPRQKIFTSDQRSRSPILDRNQQSNIQKDIFSSPQRVIQNKDRFGQLNLSDRCQANPKHSLQEIQNIQNCSMNQGKSSVQERYIDNISKNNMYNQQIAQDESKTSQKIFKILQSDKFDRNINNSQCTDIIDQPNIFSPDRNKLNKYVKFNQLQINDCYNQNTSQRNQQRELSFSPQRSRSQNENWFQPTNSSDRKSQRLSPSKISRTEISPNNPSRQQTAEKKYRKYPPIFQDTAQSSQRLSTTRQIQNSSFISTYQLDEQSASDNAFKQQNLSPVKSQKLILCSHRDQSIPILRQIETPKLNTQLFFDRSQQSTKNNDKNNQINEQQQHNQKLKQQISQSKYYSPSFNPSSLTLGDLIKSSQQHSELQSSPLKNQTQPTQNETSKNNKLINGFNQENRPNYSSYSLNCQRLNKMTGQAAQNQQLQREQSPPSTLYQQKVKLFEEIAMPMRQNMNLNDRFQDQSQENIINEQNINIQNRDSQGIKSKFIMPSQLNQ